MFATFRMYVIERDSRAPLWDELLCLVLPSVVLELQGESELTRRRQNPTGESLPLFSLNVMENKL